MKLIIPESKYKLYKFMYRIGMPLLAAGAVAGQLFIGYYGGIIIMIVGFAIFTLGLVGLNGLFVCPHCGKPMITNAKKDFKKGKNPDLCPNCKKKVVIEIKQGAEK